MPLFAVPGWSVPDAPKPDSVGSKKRKRPPSADGRGRGHAKLETAQINFEKLMEKLDAPPPPPSKKRKTKTKDVSGEARAAPRGGAGSAGRPDKKSSSRRKQRTAAKLEQAQASPSESAGGTGPVPAAERPVPVGGKRKERRRAASTPPAATGPDAAHASQHSPERPTNTNLTKLQTGLKGSLDGARFRWINEVLYKSDSEHARRMMRENPNVYEEYHTGFRRQVRAWPTSPAAHYAAQLSAYPARTVVADLGCGDAALARALVPRGLTVLSFDLVADGKYVVEADACARLPLPGGEDEGAGEGEGAAGVVDVVVCALSLMGTNWPGCIREAWRVLRAGGELKIAEVASRIADADAFVAFVCSFGFRLTAKDARNTHFTLFDFARVARTPRGEREWRRTLAGGAVLKPCEYKRR